MAHRVTPGKTEVTPGRHSYWHTRQREREREREREKREERQRDRETERQRDREVREEREREREKWDNYMLPSEVSAKLVLDQSGLSSQTWTGFQWLYPPAFWTKDTLQRSMHHKIKNISESNKDLCANALRRKNRTHWICEEWSVLSTCEWHTGMRQLDAPRHNLGHSPCNMMLNDMGYEYECIHCIKENLEIYLPICGQLQPAVQHRDVRQNRCQERSAHGRYL